VLESLLDSDDIHPELLPGEEILLLFRGLNPDEERAYIIVVEGIIHYRSQIEVITEDVGIDILHLYCMRLNDEKSDDKRTHRGGNRITCYCSIF
jgi:hypothetical protein